MSNPESTNESPPNTSTETPKEPEKKDKQKS